MTTRVGRRRRRQRAVASQTPKAISATPSTKARTGFTGLVYTTSVYVNNCRHVRLARSLVMSCVVDARHVRVDINDGRSGDWRSGQGGDDTMSGDGLSQAVTLGNSTVRRAARRPDSDHLLTQSRRRRARARRSSKPTIVGTGASSFLLTRPSPNSSPRLSMFGGGGWRAEFSNCADRRFAPLPRRRL
jgi:hypothetical protein